MDYIYIYIYIYIYNNYLDNLLSAVNGGLVHHIKGALRFFNDDDRECSRLDASYQRLITFACTGSYQLHPHHLLRIITPYLSPVPIYRPRKDG